MTFTPNNPAGLVFRSNPLSTGNGMAVAYIENQAGDTELEFDYTVNGGATSVAFTATLFSSVIMKYFNITITDTEGNEASGQLPASDISLGTTIDVSGLNPSLDWCFNIAWAEASQPAKFNGTQDVLTGTKANANRAFSTEKIEGTLQVWAEKFVNGVSQGAAASVADAGTVAFGNVAQDAVAYVLLTFKNTMTTGNKPLIVNMIIDDQAAMTVSTAFGESVSLPVAIAIDSFSNSSQRVDLDTTALGAIAASSVTIISNTSNVLYVVNFTATIV